MSLEKAIEMIDKLTAHLEQVSGYVAKPKKKPTPVQQPKTEEVPALIQSFQKCDLRVSLIKTCEPVKDSDKLLLMTLDVGNEIRTFAAGIQQYYKPEDLIGKKIVTILNLKPRPMCNGTVISAAMLFAGSSESSTGRQVKLCFPDQTLKPGTPVVPLGYEPVETPKADPKKNFERVLKVLKTKHNKMTLDDKIEGAPYGLELTAGGKPIMCDLPDGCSIG